jgi:hypothetical protein
VRTERLPRRKQAALCFGTLLAAGLFWALRTEHGSTPVRANDTPPQTPPEVTLLVAPGAAPSAHERAASPLEAGLRVRLVDESGSPVGAAKVAFLAADGRRYTAVQSESAATAAVYAATKLPASGGVFEAEADGYARHQQRVELVVGDNDLGTIVLAEGAWIDGAVTHVDGSMPRIPLRAIAYPANIDRDPEAAQIVRALAGDRAEAASIVTIADVAADGRFRLTGLRRNASYMVAAGGAGWVASRRQILETGAGPTTAATMHLWRLSGVGIDIVDARSRARIQSRFMTRTHGPESGVSVIPIESALAGLFPDAYNARCTDVLLGARPTEDEVTMPFRVEIPGFATRTVDVAIRPIELDRIRVCTIEMEQLASGLGSILVTIASDLPATDRELRTNRSLLTLTVDATDGSGMSLQTALGDLRARTVAMEGVPHGSYRVAIQRHGQPLFEATTTLGPGKDTAQLAWATKGTLASVELAPDLAGFEGPLYVNYDVALGNLKGQVSFSGPPYRIDGLPRGEFVRLQCFGLRIEGDSWKQCYSGSAEAALRDNFQKIALVAASTAEGK